MHGLRHILDSFVLLSYNSLCSETSTIYLPAMFSIFLVFFFVFMKTTLYSRHWSAIKKALDVGRFFFFFLSEKSNFFQLEKTLWAAEKDAASGGVLKRAQDFFENHVYSIGL